MVTSKKHKRHSQVLDSIVVSIPACHAGDRGSIPRRGEIFRFKIKIFRIGTVLLLCSFDLFVSSLA